MKLTQEEINEIKQDPLYKLLAALTGRGDDIIKDFVKDSEKEELKKKPLDSSKEGKLLKAFPLSFQTIIEIVNRQNEYHNFLHAGGLDGYSNVLSSYGELLDQILLELFGVNIWNEFANATPKSDMNKLYEQITKYYNE